MMNYQEQLQQIQTNPIEMGKEKGYNIPEELAGDPKSMVMHLINSGQVGGPLLQKVRQMMMQMGCK